jgi:hypothetical protein
MKRVVIGPASSTTVPSAVAPKTDVVCATCGSEFAKQSNLKRHVETKHTDQTTPEAVAKRLEVKEYHKKNRRKRRLTDSVYREKEKQISRKNRINKNVCQVAEDNDHTVSNGVKSTDVSMLVETEADEEKGGVMPTDIVHTLQAPHTVPKIIGEVGERVKKARKNDKNPTGVPGRVETTVLTTANVTSFFTAKYEKPRTRAQRAANPRPSAI